MNKLAFISRYRLFVHMTMSAKLHALRPSPASEGLRRLVIHKGNRLLPHIEHGGWTMTARALENNLPAHHHNDAYEFCYLVAGEAHWWVGNQVFHLSPHHVFMTRPDEMHGGVDDMMHPCELYWLQLRIKKAGDLGYTAEEIRQFHTAWHGVHARVAPARKDMLPLFQRILEEHRKPDSYSPLRVRALCQLLVTDMLAALQHADARSDVHPVRYSTPVKRAVAVLADGLGGPPPLADAGRAAGLRPTQFRLRFRQETGFTPQEFFLRLRLREAQQLLREKDLDITTIAHRLGFYSSQHFAKFFKNRTGLTPTRYRVARAGKSETTTTDPFRG